VWDYPRPPAVERCSRLVEVELRGVTIASTRRALRVLETSHPPVYYIPPEDFVSGCLTETSRTSYCEFKGLARYLDVSAGGRVERVAAWGYEEPTIGFEEIARHVAVYPARMDACYVDGERVRAQQGDFYGGWITPEIVGPFKGGPGTVGW
jgi:uncharacterized protein (DUF427 family)